VGAPIDGGFAEFAKIPERNVLPIPEGIGFAEAGVSTDTGATNCHVFKGRTRTRPKPGPDSKESGPTETAEARIWQAPVTI
jgi:D-arabinose 1-dehydrogenase-like Zn-dependent alcohol dehydrogenase